LIDAVTGVVQVAVPKPHQEPQVRAGPGVLTLHLVPPDCEGKVLPPVARRGIFDAPCEGLIKIVGLLDDQLAGLDVSCRIAPGEFHSQSVSFSDRIFRSRASVAHARTTPVVIASSPQASTRSMSFRKSAGVFIPSIDPRA